MRTRWLGILTAVVALVPALSGAAEAPHDGSFSDDDCGNCHSLYNPTSGGQTDYSPGCYSCHNASSPRFGQWVPGDQASPGFGGNHHAWSAYADNPLRGAHYPTSGAMAARLADGKIQCSTCHDPHLSSPGNAPGGAPDVSIPVGSAVPEKGNLLGPAGSSQMTLVASGTATRGYRLKIQSVDGTGGTFAISHTFGMASPVWLNWSGAAWVVGTEGGAGRRYDNNAEVALDDPAVRVKWTAGAAPGDYWDFYVSYPFLRLTTAGDILCKACHKGMVMGHVRVGGYDPSYRPDGVRTFSHPVGEALNANGLDHDRTPTNPDPTARELLDATGVAQSVGDGNATNDLRLESGVVRCTTCHAVHNADSNSLTTDNR